MTKTNLPKAQHYVPRFILNNFCIGDTSQVFVFDKRHESVFKTNILKKIGLLKKLEIEQRQLDSFKKIKHALDTGEAVNSRKENVVNKNSLQVMHSTRFVFSGIDNFDLIREMFKNNIDFKKPPRMQKN